MIDFDWRSARPIKLHVRRREMYLSVLLALAEIGQQWRNSVKAK